MDRDTLNLALARNSAAIAARQFASRRAPSIAGVKCSAFFRRVYRCPDQQLLRRLENGGSFQKEIART